MESNEQETRESKPRSLWQLIHAFGLLCAATLVWASDLSVMSSLGLTGYLAFLIPVLVMGDPDES